MKKIYTILCISIFLIYSWIYAFQPSSDLEKALQIFTEKLEKNINDKWEYLRELYIQRFEVLKWKYADNQKALYIIDFLVDALQNNNISFQNAEIQSNYLWNYTIDNDIYQTQTQVKVTEKQRTITTNSLPNHDTWIFPNVGNPNSISAQNIVYTFPIQPKYLWNAIWAKEPWVAINGVKFEPETAERVICQSWESYKIEAIQNFTNLGLDFNNAHVQPTGAYHYHGVPKNLIDTLQWEDIVHVGFAQDGFLIYYSKKWSYDSSYSLIDKPREGNNCKYRSKEIDIEWTIADGTFVSDWEYKEWSWNLDRCNGAFVNGVYAYFITNEYPYVWRCLNGEYTQTKKEWRHGHPHPPRKQ